MKSFDVRAAFFTGLLLACAGTSHAVQNDCGRPDCSKPAPPASSGVAPKPPRPKPRPAPRVKPGSRSGGGGDNATSGGGDEREPVAPPTCEAAEVLVRCGVPG